MKKQSTKKIQGNLLTVACLGIGLFTTCGEISAKDTFEEQMMPSQADKNYSFSEAAIESMTGDVYSDSAAKNWQELSYRNLFSKGWNKPWVSPPNGSGGAPRQGWLNASDGVFYRLGIAVFSWQHGLNNGDGYVGNLVNYTPINQRFQIQTNISMNSNRGGTGNETQTNFGDFRIAPRVILSESKDTTQLFSVNFRTPTGNSFNGNGVASITPEYQFWTNPWKGLVVRGGAGFTVPYAGELYKTGARSTFDANLAVGYYFTPHDFTPFGDMVWYLATNINQPIDNRAATSNTFVSLAPGFRTHLGQNWYLLGSVEVPVSHPQPYDYQVMGGIMKVY